MSKPLISVIVPVFNVQDYLYSCLNSIINQTYDNIEIICINDCSTDKSTIILDKFKKQDERIILINHKKNLGLSAARNTGLNYANGKYISFIDSDDVINTNYFENLIKMVSIKNHDIVISNIYTFSEHIEKLEKCWYPNTDIQDYFRTKITTNLYEYYHYLPVMAWGKLYSAEFLKELNIRFIPGILHEDEPWALQIFANTKNFTFCNNAIYYYRQRENSIMKMKETANFSYCIQYIKTIKSIHNTNLFLYINKKYNKNFFFKIERENIKGIKNIVLKFDKFTNSQIENQIIKNSYIQLLKDLSYANFKYFITSFKIFKHLKLTLKVLFLLIKFN